MVCVTVANTYLVIVYSQIGLIVEFHFYLECFIEDIRFQLGKIKNAKEILVGVIEFHFKMIRFLISNKLFIFRRNSFSSIDGFFDDIHEIMSGTIFPLLIAGVTFLAATIFAIDYVSFFVSF